MARFYYILDQKICLDDPICNYKLVGGPVLNGGHRGKAVRVRIPWGVKVERVQGQPYSRTTDTRPVCQFDPLPRIRVLTLSTGNKPQWKSFPELLSYSPSEWERILFQSIGIELCYSQDGYYYTKEAFLRRCM